MLYCDFIFNWVGCAFGVTCFGVEVRKKLCPVARVVGKGEEAIAGFVDYAKELVLCLLCVAVTRLANFCEGKVSFQTL